MLADCFLISDGTMKPNRVGLSEYTARRLAELRARRAEADDTGGISIGTSSSSSTAAAEATVNDSNSSTVPPAVTTQPPTASGLASDSGSNTAAPVSVASQLSSSNDVSASSNLSKPASCVTSAPTAAVSNGISNGLRNAVDMTVRQKQLTTVKTESAPSEQRRIDRQDLSNPHMATELSRPAVQHREIAQPGPSMRSTSHSSDTAKLPGFAGEVASLNKMVIIFYCN